ncbi:MAG: hypothetical protein A2508_03210 [Candidatus Lambdaproteobacteria bacterium RIFOXYD12_FULL_49_8]|uniref:CBS domain-containing protein n=1 Tax=Candidatus Lambdaproteobacteria bacterium RIFOXYD2_FULL_50_16 TaxID=1817772 RepID=A0A1F6GEV0_9PROT|nr:MAG: hypothetical protein A2527_03475 [Candidatus Lambdaproteobacteria bacterium RIFOXYD2_FULL_50_16]OGG97851.1 MAG: hypothetical protein A2508_03210 [Candidatus Lambdaproteobacteria bacterium RIFOXYD12_FULL_49_8]
MDGPGSYSLLDLIKKSFSNFSADENKEASVVNPEETVLLDNLEHYFLSTACEVNTPRTQMITLEKDATVNEAIKVFLECGYSRIPVQEGKTDNIVGICVAIDLFAYVDEGRDKKLSEIMRDPLFVSYSKPIHQLLSEFQQKGMHMAIVVDEYGGVDGLITVTDIIEELVGEIPDTTNRHEDPGWSTDEDGNILMDASFELFEFNELYNTDFDKDGIETIGGYVCHKLGKIPLKGEQIQLGNVHITVEDTTDRSLTKLKISRPSNLP